MVLGYLLWAAWSASAATILLGALLSVFIKLPVYGPNRTIVGFILRRGFLPTVGTLALVIIAQRLGSLATVPVIFFLGVPAFLSIGRLVTVWRNRHMFRAELRAELHHKEEELAAEIAEWRREHGVVQDV